MSAATLPFGAEMGEAGRGRFRLWAPSAGSVVLVLPAGEGRATREVPMQREQDGWFGAQASAPAGATYFFRIEGRIDVPDPASRANDDVHGPSGSSTRAPMRGATAAGAAGPGTRR